jgi:hypothetical protein
MTAPHLVSAPTNREDERVIALENAPMPAVALNAGRDEPHIQLVRQQATQHHGDLRTKVLGELLRHALQ